MLKQIKEGNSILKFNWLKYVNKMKQQSSSSPLPHDSMQNGRQEVATKSAGTKTHKTKTNLTLLPLHCPPNDLYTLCRPKCSCEMICSDVLNPYLITNTAALTYARVECRFSTSLGSSDTLTIIIRYIDHHHPIH